MGPVAREYQLGRDSNAVIRAAYASLDYVGHAQSPADGGQICLLPLEGKGRSTTDNLEFGNFDEKINNRLCHSITKIFLVVLLAHVDERQHGDGLIVDDVRGGSRQL